MRIPADIQPIGHISPRPRIDLNPRYVEQPGPAGAEMSFSPVYCDQVWRLLRQCAEGTNAPNAPVIEPIPISQPSECHLSTQEIVNRALEELDRWIYCDMSRPETPRYEQANVPGGLMSLDPGTVPGQRPPNFGTKEYPRLPE